MHTTKKGKKNYIKEKPRYRDIFLITADQTPPRQHRKYIISTSGGRRGPRNWLEAAARFSPGVAMGGRHGSPHANNNCKDSTNPIAIQLQRLPSFNCKDSTNPRHFCVKVLYYTLKIDALHLNDWFDHNTHALYNDQGAKIFGVFPSRKY
jgi:hypothetical protein